MKRTETRKSIKPSLAASVCRAVGDFRVVNFLQIRSSGQFFGSTRRQDIEAISAKVKRIQESNSQVIREGTVDPMTNAVFRNSGRPHDLWWSPDVKRQLLVSLGATIVFGIVVLVLYLNDRAYEKSLHEYQARYRLDMGQELISREVKAVRSDLLYLAEQKILSRFLSGDESARAELESEYKRFAEQKQIYDQIRYLDASGAEVIRVNFVGGRVTVVPATELQHKDDRYYFREAIELERGEVFTSDFDLNIEHGTIERPLKPVLRFATPVFDSSGQRRGILVLNFLGARLLRDLIDFALPGSTMLVRSDGQYLLGLQPEDAWGWILDHDRSFDKQFPKVWPSVEPGMTQTAMMDEGMFLSQVVDLGSNSNAARSLGSTTEPQSDFASTDRGRSSLILVSYLSRADFYARSTSLLWQLLLIVCGAILVVFVMAGFWARATTIREQQAKKISDSESRLRALSSQLFSAQEVERRAISREIHDGLGQQVTAVNLDLKSALRHPDIDKSKSILERAIAETDEVLKSLHLIAARVRPAVLDDLGLLDAVESYLSEFQQRSGIIVAARLNFQVNAISRTIGENVYRILQESLANVAKHARTKQAWIEIETNEDSLRLSIRDRGAGFSLDQQNSSRLGLLGMRERVELLDGEFQINSSIGNGTEIYVSLPLNTRTDKPVGRLMRG